VPAQVRVVDSDELNAFALPGGHFFINTGLILEAQTEAELASMIAHEIAHVAARHATKQRTKANIWNWASIPLLLFGGPLAYSIYQGAAIAVPLTFLKFSRNAEQEADFLGLQYHYKAGYDPVAFVDFFERLKRREKEGERGGIAKVFSTHPMTKDRIKQAEDVIERYLPEREEYVVTTSRFDQVRSYLERLLGQRARARQPGAGPLLRDRTGSVPDNFEPHDPF
jgi:predicted Zn-dependent protease